MNKILREYEATVEQTSIAPIIVWAYDEEEAEDKIREKLEKGELEFDVVKERIKDLGEVGIQHTP